MSWICDCRLTCFPSKKAMDEHECLGEDAAQTLLEIEDPVCKKRVAQYFKNGEARHDLKYIVNPAH